MGIPYYFATIIRQQRTILSRVVGCQTPDVFAIDFNCLIHNYIDDANPINSVIVALRNILTKVCKATKFTYVAMDGVVPYAKMVQQRYRRFRKQESTPVFDRNQISPETLYMKELAAAISSEFPDVILSSTAEPGEGEHKLLSWLKTLPENQRRSVCVYGLDADLILLCLVQRKLSMPYSFSLLRENMAFNRDEQGFSTLSVWRLADHIKIPVEQYVPLSLFCFGNDFMPNIGMFSLREGGHDLALKVYNAAGCPDMTTRDGIRRFIQQASNDEMAFYKEKVDARNKKSERAVFSKDGAFFKERYNLHILDGVTNSNTVASEFIKAFDWTLHYFLKNEVPDWNWYYPYADAPLVCQLNDCPEFSEYSFDNKLTYSAIQQLQFILPSSSIRKNKKRVMFPDEFYNEETEVRLPWMKRYKWECEPQISLPWHPTEKETRIEVWSSEQ